jgi:hypothetical protein
MQRVLVLSISAAITWAASASAADITEFYGTGFRNPSTSVTAQEILSDCGDSNSSTNVTLFTFEGSATYTGIIQGTGTVLNKQLVNNCSAAASPGHAGFRLLDRLQSVSVAGRTGGAVIEIIGIVSVPVANVTFFDNRIRILCGTGQLKGIQAEGTLTATQETGGVNVRPLQLWGHFDPPGQANEFDFLCSGLPN